MTIQTRAKLTLKLLKGTGVSYKAFAQAAGINVESIYALSKNNYKLTEARAEYYIYAAEKLFP